MAFDTEKRAKTILPVLKEVMRETLVRRTRPDFKVFSKADESPVTSADLWANDELTSEIARLFPGEPVIGEESEDKSYPAGAQMMWYLDPIDGTKNYISKNLPYHILIGCCVDGVPVLGMCGYPESDEVVVGGLGMPARIWEHDGRAQALPKAERWHEGKRHKFSLKGMTEEQRKEFRNAGGLVKPPAVLGHPTMMGPAFGITDGFIDMRAIHWWDRCAPAAIMRSLGYDVGNAEDGSCIMNDGAVLGGNFHCLPPATPAPIKKLLYHGS